MHAISRKAAYIGLVPDEALAVITADGQASYWRARLEREPAPTALLVSERSDRDLDGFAFASARGTIGMLHAIHVVPLMLGTGLGQALHDTVLHQFHAWGCAAAELSVLEGNDRAQAFYRHNGWLRCPTVSHHEIGGAEVEIHHYRRSLAPENDRQRHRDSAICSVSDAE